MTRYDIGVNVLMRRMVFAEANQTIMLAGVISTR